MISEPSTPNSEALKATPMACIGAVRRSTSMRIASLGSLPPVASEKAPISLPISASAPSRPMKVPNSPSPTIMPDMNCGRMR